MKTYKVKNYKGNLVESLSRFQNSHKDMKIVEACEDGDDLKITVNEGSSYVGAKYLNVPTLKELVDWLVKFRKTYPDLSNKTVYATKTRLYVYDNNNNEVDLGVMFDYED